MYVDVLYIILNKNHTFAYYTMARAKTSWQIINTVPWNRSVLTIKELTYWIKTVNFTDTSFIITTRKLYIYIYLNSLRRYSSNFSFHTCFTLKILHTTMLFGSQWWTGRPGVLWFMGLQRVGHDWATDLSDAILQLSLVAKW